MTAHKHAAAMLQYAQDATETDKPWERWEFLHDWGEWVSVLAAHPQWDLDTDYRRKPNPVKTETRTYECWDMGTLVWIRKQPGILVPPHSERVPSKDITAEVVLK